MTELSEQELVEWARDVQRMRRRHRNEEREGDRRLDTLLIRAREAGMKHKEIAAALNVGSRDPLDELEFERYPELLQRKRYTTSTIKLYVEHAYFMAEAEADDAS